MPKGDPAEGCEIYSRPRKPPLSSTASAPGRCRRQNGALIAQVQARQNRGVQREQLQELRVAIYGGKGADLVAVLGTLGSDDVLQLAGDALVRAVNQAICGAKVLAKGWVELRRLSDRSRARTTPG
jgi:hypothetical protein